MARRRNRGGGVPVVAAGGVSAPKRPSPKPNLKNPYASPGAFTSPPAFTFDPGIEAERRAAKRGLHDTEQDVRTKGHFAKTDLATALRDIHITTGRKRQDIAREYGRGVRKLGYERTDVQTKAGRSQADLDAQLQNIGRQFAALGHRQGEEANAQGVNDAGTAAAGAVARGRNQQLAEQPVKTAKQRVADDLASALQRITVGEAELGNDTIRTRNRLLQDRNLERQKVKRETGRKLLEGHREVQRAKREAVFTNIDKLLQEIYQAREGHPGAFSKTGQKKNKGGKKGRH